MGGHLLSTPTRLHRGRDIIKAVLAERKLAAEDFFSNCREAHLFDARKDAARRLIAAGFSPASAARLMKRNPTTILNYFPKMAEKKRSRYVAKIVLRQLDPEAQSLISEFARAQNMPVDSVMARWLNEFAQYKAANQTRCRAA